MGEHTLLPLEIAIPVPGIRLGLRRCNRFICRQIGLQRLRVSGADGRSVR
jgi:hypothetical protein